MKNKDEKYLIASLTDERPLDLGSARWYRTQNTQHTEYNVSRRSAGAAPYHGFRFIL